VCFTPPVRLTPEAIADLANIPAAYKVFPPDGKWPKGIHRFLGIDNERVLFYGKTGDLKGRLKALLRSIGQKDGHSEGNLIHILNREADGFGIQQVMFSYKAEDTEEAATEEEERLIKKYIQRFGEVPPINSAIPKRNGPWP